jgi:DNA-binding MarR family transcriptional regulator
MSTPGSTEAGDPESTSSESTSNETSSNETTRAAARLRTVVGRLSRRLGSSGPGGGLTPSQLSVLGAVARHGPMRLSELADHEGVNPTMLSRIVGKLCDEGLILRRSDDRDRRAFHVEVTEAGREQHDRIVALRTETLAAGLDRLSPSDRERLLGALPALELLVADLTAAHDARHSTRQTARQLAGAAR